MQNASIDLTRVQQGRLLHTRRTENLSDRQKEVSDREEKLIMFSNFTEEDQGRSRNFIARFVEPNLCKDFVDNYNAMIDKIYEQQKYINKLEERYDDFANMF